MAKYKTIIETDDYKDFKFFEDGDGKYMVGKDENAKGNEWIPLHFTECEQDDSLDKIRAEILVLDDADYDFDGYYKAVTDALKIIDKYKAEREDKG